MRDPFPIPEGGWKTNEEEARWLAATIDLRTTEGLARVGIPACIASEGLYELILGSLKAAGARTREQDQRRVRNEAYNDAIAVLKAGIENIVLDPGSAPASPLETLRIAVQIIDASRRNSVGEAPIDPVIAQAVEEGALSLLLELQQDCIAMRKVLEPFARLWLEYAPLELAPETPLPAAKLPGTRPTMGDLKALFEAYSGEPAEAQT